MCDIDDDGASETAKSLETPSISVGLDVSDRAAVVAAVAHIGEDLGPIDILVNNAGIDVIEPFMESTEETWDRLWDVNLKGQIACCHAVLGAHMIPELAWSHREPRIRRGQSRLDAAKPSTRPRRVA